MYLPPICCVDVYKRQEEGFDLVGARPIGRVLQCDDVRLVGCAEGGSRFGTSVLAVSYTHLRIALLQRIAVVQFEIQVGVLAAQVEVGLVQLEQRARIDETASELSLIHI